MKLSAFGLTVLGLALLSTASAHAQVKQNTNRSYTNVDAFGNVTTTTVEAPTSVAEELAQQRLFGGLPLSSTTIAVGSGFYSGYPNYGVGYSYGPIGYPYPYPTYGYGYPPGYPAPYPYGYGYPYPYPPQQQLPVSGPIGVPGYSGPSYTSIPLGTTYYYPPDYCPPGYYGGGFGGITGSYSQKSESVGIGLSNGKPSISATYRTKMGSTSGTITR